MNPSISSARSLLLLAFALFVFGASIPCAHTASPASSNAITTPADGSSTPTFFPFDNIPQSRMGVFYTYQTAADGSPTGYSAVGLPDGLAIDPASGLISGTPTVQGTFTVTLSAANANGTGTAVLTLVALPPLPVVTLTAEIPSGYPAQGIVGSFLLTRTGDTSEPLSVSVLIKGSAVNGQDYQGISMTKHFKPGKATKEVRIQAVDESGQGITKKTVKFVLQTSDVYNVTDATVAKVKIFYTP